MKYRVQTALLDEEHMPDAGDRLGDLLGRLEEPARLALVFASPAHDLGAILATLARRLPETVCLGATTAGEFTERRVAKRAISAIAVSGDFHVHAALGTDLAADPAKTVASVVEKTSQRHPSHPHRTAILLLDPLSGRGEEATLLTAAVLGPDVPLVGGAAGDDLAMTKASVGVGAELGSDALALAILHTREPLGVGVLHGHAPISRPLTVTRAKDNTVFEIDGRPAWDVWVEHTGARAREAGIDPAKLRDEDVSSYLLRFEAGLSTGSEYKIRAPLSKGADGSLSFACGIPSGAEIVITESEPKRQVQSALGAARRAREALGGAPTAGAIVFDCICRNLILGEEFREAVTGMSRELGDAPLAGFETYGEIAMAQGDFSGFHNTTTVVLAFPGGPPSKP